MQRDNGISLFPSHWLGFCLTLVKIKGFVGCALIDAFLLENVNNNDIKEGSIIISGFSVIGKFLVFSYELVCFLFLIDSKMGFYALIRSSNHFFHSDYIYILFSFIWVANSTVEYSAFKCDSDLLHI